jgi:4-hydroxy-tetrahydrodipicolinate reductase
MATRIKVVIAGINGRFGKATARLFTDDPNFQLVGAFGRAGASYVGQDIGKLTNSASTDILVSNSISELPTGVQPDVLVDFTVADAAVENAKYALEHNIRPVIGTSGVGDDDIKTLSEIAQRKKLGAMVVPNFSVGAVLMMEFAQQAARYFEHVEVVEMHHTRKLDSPSGTAMHTVKKMEELGKSYNAKEVEDHPLLANARGARSANGVHVHSIRLPGLLSHQEVIFGSPGELLTVRHDGLTTDSYLRGIKMAAEAVMNFNNLQVGLDKILDLSKNSTASQQLALQK